MTPMSLYFDSGTIANSTAYVKTLLELGNGARQLEGDILEVSMDPIYRKAQPSDLQQPRDMKLGKSIILVCACSHLATQVGALNNKETRTRNIAFDPQIALYMHVFCHFF
jgi:hypothetical protein